LVGVVDFGVHGGTAGVIGVVIVIVIAVVIIVTGQQLQVVIHLVFNVQLERSSRHPLAPVHRELLPLVLVERGNGRTNAERHHVLGQHDTKRFRVLGAERVPKVLADVAKQDGDTGIGQGQDQNGYQQPFAAVAFLVIRSGHLAEQTELLAHAAPVDFITVFIVAAAVLLGWCCIIRVFLVERRIQNTALVAVAAAKNVTPQRFGAAAQRGGFFLVVVAATTHCYSIAAGVRERKRRGKGVAAATGEQQQQQL